MIAEALKSRLNNPFGIYFNRSKTNNASVWYFNIPNSNILLKNE
jgi:hypothetical protein